MNLRTGQTGIFPIAHVVDVEYNDFDPEIGGVSRDDKKERYLLDYLGSVETSMYKGNIVLCQAVRKISLRHTTTSSLPSPNLMSASASESSNNTNLLSASMISTASTDYFCSEPQRTVLEISAKGIKMRDKSKTNVRFALYFIDFVLAALKKAETFYAKAFGFHTNGNCCGTTFCRVFSKE